MGISSGIMVPQNLNSVGAPYTTPMVWPAQPPFILSIRASFERVTDSGAFGAEQEAARRSADSTAMMLLGFINLKFSY